MDERRLLLAVALSLLVLTAYSLLFAPAPRPRPQASPPSRGEVLPAPTPAPGPAPTPGTPTPSRSPIGRAVDPGGTDDKMTLTRASICRHPSPERCPVTIPIDMFSEEHEVFRAQCRRFIEKELAPHADAWEDAKDFPDEAFHRAGEADGGA